MKNYIIPSRLLLAAVTAFSICSVAVASPNEEAALTKEAKISKADAEKTALAKVRNGSIKSGEIEREHGKLVWSFDLTQPRMKGVTEIQVDAITGRIASRKRETPAQEAAEAKAEARGTGTLK